MALERRINQSAALFSTPISESKQKDAASLVQRARPVPPSESTPTPAGVDSHVYSRSNTRMLLGLL